MAWRALREAGLPFDLIRSDDIRAGALSHYAMIFVPGGWASAKLRSLGEKGHAEICSFVENGGSYWEFAVARASRRGAVSVFCPFSEKPRKKGFPASAGRSTCLRQTILSGRT